MCLESSLPHSSFFVPSEGIHGKDVCPLFQQGTAVSTCVYLWSLWPGLMPQSEGMVEPAFVGQQSGPHPHQVSPRNRVWELDLHGESRQWVTEMNTFPLRPPLRLPLPNLLFASPVLSHQSSLAWGHRALWMSLWNAACTNGGQSLRRPFPEVSLNWNIIQKIEKALAYCVILEQK